MGGGDWSHNIDDLPELLVWGRFMANDEATCVGADRIWTVAVSTVFLGIDLSFDAFLGTDLSEGGSPLLFESMVFGGKLDGVQRRYATWDEAAAGHALLCAQVRRYSLVSFFIDWWRITRGAPHILWLCAAVAAVVSTAAQLIFHLPVWAAVVLGFLLGSISARIGLAIHAKRKFNANSH